MACNNRIDNVPVFEIVDIATASLNERMLQLKIRYNVPHNLQFDVWHSSLISCIIEESEETSAAFLFNNG